MPDTNKKISTPSEESPCGIKLACSAETTGTGGKTKATCSKLFKIVEGKSKKAGKGCKSAAAEEKATLNKEPCSPGPACHLARPDRTDDPASRIDKTKSGCSNFESCEEEEEKTVEHRLASGCLDYEDCKDYLQEEKRRIKKIKDDAKQKKKEELAKAKAEWKDTCSR